MKAWHAWHKSGAAARHEIRVAMTAEEWQDIVDIVWDWAEDLDEPTIANFLLTMKKVNINAEETPKADG